MDEHTIRLAAIKVAAKLGCYAKHTTRDGRYYYITGPFLLGRPKFVVIEESLEHKQDEWVKSWIDKGAPAAVLYFAFWKLKMQKPTKATYQEVEWFYGFQAVAKSRR